MLAAVELSNHSRGRKRSGLGWPRQPNTLRRRKLTSRRVRADRLDSVVWEALCALLRQPTVIPKLHQTWVQAKQHTLSALTAQQTQLQQRQQRLERQSQRLLDAYQAEIISLSELQSRRQKLNAEWQQIEQERQHLAQS